MSSSETLPAPVVISNASTNEINWKKYLGIGAAVIVGGATLYYLLYGSGNRRANLREADQKVDEASVKKEEEDWESAEKLFYEALVILRRHLDKNDENIANIYKELADCALNKMELDKAEEYSRDCLRIKEHNHGRDSPLICGSLVELAGILTALKEPEPAIDYASWAQRIYESVAETERDYAGLSKALRTRAAAVMLTEAYPEAQEAALRALECFDKVFRIDDIHNHYRDAMEGHLLLAKIYIKQGNFEAAEGVYRDLVQKAKDMLGPADIFVAHSLRNLGDFYEDREQIDDAEAAYKEALAVARKKYPGPEDNTNVFAFLNNLVHFYWDHDRETEARTAFAELKKMKCLPSPTNSRCFVTRLFAFTFTRSPDNPHKIEPVYIGDLLPTNKLPSNAYLEVHYQNPEDESDPIIQERPIIPDDRESVVLLSPPVRGVKKGTYEIAVHIYSDSTKTQKLGVHYQLCESVFDTDKIKTEEDLMQHIPPERMC